MPMSDYFPRGGKLISCSSFKAKASFSHMPFEKRTVGSPFFYFQAATWCGLENTYERSFMNQASAYFYIYLSYLQGYIAISNHAFYASICPNELCRIQLCFMIHVKQGCISWVLEVPSTKPHRRITVLVIAWEESGNQNSPISFSWIGYYLVVDSFIGTPNAECALRTCIIVVEPSLRTWVWIHLLDKSTLHSVFHITHPNNGNDTFELLGGSNTSLYLTQYNTCCVVSIPTFSAIIMTFRIQTRAWLW